MQSALKVEHLTVHYHNTPVLWDITLDVPKGKLVGILGPNGAGKSTFIKALLGLLTPVSGSVVFFDKKKGKGKSFAPGKVAYLPQREAIDWDFPITVEELVLMGAYPKLGLFRWISKKEKEKAKKCLGQVGMLEFAERQISELSGGQQQRAFLARALMQEADIYFLDESLSGVDHSSEDIIMTILRKMRDEGKTIFMVHHDLHNVDAYFDWVILLNLRLVAAGPKEIVFTSNFIQEAYGKDFHILDDITRLQQEKSVR